MAKTDEIKVADPVKEGETPSMEEILQSIRGVISGEEQSTEDGEVLELTEMVEETATPEVKPETAKPESSATAAEEPGKSILDDIDAALTPEAEKEKAPEAAPVAAVETQVPAAEKVEIKETADKEASETPATIEKAGKPEAEPESTTDLDADKEDDILEATSPSKGISGRLLDDATVKQSSVPLRELVSNIHEKHIDSPHTRTGTSLEDLVIEAMKPFLAEWLNKNLPAVVKKIVEKEVKRLIPKEDDDN